MDRGIEDNFVKTFVVKDKRDRLLYELFGKKREQGIGRFCHNADKMLVKGKIAASGNHLYYDEILQEVEKYKVSGNWYIMSMNKSMDGIVCQFDEALDLVLGNGMAAIIVSDSIAIVETEQYRGTPVRYILHHQCEK